MSVVSASRQRGVGRQLVAEALSFALSELCVRQVTLGVNAENKAAIALYERTSFKSFGREPCFMFVDGLAHDELQMTCLLHAAPRAPVSHATVSLFDSKIKTRLARGSTGVAVPKAG